VDSLSHQPGIRSPKARAASVESGKPADGLSRRYLLAGPVMLPATAALPAAPDPVFALIAAKKAANVAHGSAIDVQDAADAQYGHDS